MIFGEGPIIKNIAGDLNKLFLQGTRAGQPINNVEGDAAADQGTTALMADRDPVIRDISTGLGYGIRNVTISGIAPLHLVNALDRSIEITTTIEPVQDLHGYDSPWPAGGGKNLIDYNAIIKDGTSQGITFKENTNGDITATGVATGGLWVVASMANLAAGEYKAVISCTDETIKFCVLSGASSVLNLTSNAVTSFTIPENVSYSIGINRINVGDVFNGVFSVMVVPASETDTTFAPYANICPISGWDEVNVTRAGENLLDAYTATWKKWQLNNNVFTTKSDSYGVINYTQNPNQTISITAFGTWVGICVEIDAEPYERVVSVNDGYRLLLYDKYEDGANVIVGGSGLSKVIPANTSCVAAILLNEVRDYIITAQLELGSTATSYEPYQGNTYTIEMPTDAGTVYGGELTVNKDGSGSLVVDRASADLGTLTWTKANNCTHSFVTQNIPKPFANDNILCSMYRVSGLRAKDATLPTIEQSNDKCIVTYDGSSRVTIIDSSYTDATTFTTAMSGVQLVYELSTPLTYTLTATQIKALKGDNNIWTDCGDTLTVIYEQSV